MSTFIQNYGYTKTYTNDKYGKNQEELMWQGDYDGNMANIDINVNKNGQEQFVSMKLDNNDIIQLLGVPVVNAPLHKRLQQDFMKNGLIRDGLITNRRTKKKSHKKHKHHKRHKKTIHKRKH